MAEPASTSVKSPYRVPFDGSLRVAAARTAPPKDAPDKEACKQRLAECIEELAELQHILYAHDNHAVLLVFQAMDAAGKDSTIRAVLSGIDPAGCQVFSFKSPSAEDLDHDFLWRTARCLPEKGRIGVFNRSYYEEVLVVRVHPEYLKAQRVPNLPDQLERLWDQRYRSIRGHEKHLAHSGTVIIKFWLNVSKAEQRKRFLARLEEPEKNWKFNAADVQERARWREYMRAYEDALNATSQPWAPWYAIPADDKHYMRMCVAEIVVRTLKRLDLRYPQLDPAQRRRFARMRAYLQKN
jgi:PPK2 family polyphosphate:nucleotide phosphotransferase